jgi:VanZ family protein
MGQRLRALLFLPAVGLLIIPMQRLSVNFGLWFGWTTFVVYGSLVPFDFRPLPLDHAIALFRQAPFLQLGVESRADWIANGVLYVPIGLLTTRLLLAFSGGRAQPVAILLAVAFGVSLAFLVEFTQVFFPPRVVSRNDLLAECLGSILGAVLAPWLRPWVARFRGFWSLGGRRLVVALLEVYIAAYLLQSMFPFDVLLDAREWADKLASGRWGWFMASASLQRGWIAVLFLGIELVMALPIGLLLAAWWPARRNMFGKAMVLGLVVGLAIELGQLAIDSGISQGASAIARGFGAALGWWSWRQWADHGGLMPFRRALCRLAGPLALAYLAVLLAVNGWLSRSWGGLDAAKLVWAKLRLMPFYYHYHSTEADAVFSLGSVMLMYLPVVAIGWARRWHPVASVGVAVFLATVIELSKLFLEGLHPDASNPLIVLGACSAAVWLLAAIERPAKADRGRNAGGSAGVGATRPVAAPSPIANTASTWVVAAAALALVALSLALFPAQRWLVFAVLLVSAVAVWIRPASALIMIPGALPVFDLAPWTGRFYWDEFDLMMLVVLAVGWARTMPIRYRVNTGLARVLPLALWLLGISLVASTVRGMWPWQWPDLNSFNSYYSDFNALRVAKGGIWALALVSLYRRIDLSGVDKFRRLAWGMCAGLTATVAVIAWERAAFVGLSDFDTDYRITGPFSAMHTGGAYVECYLALAAPFLIWLIVNTPGLLVRVLGGILLILTTYAMMVTYSRNGYAALLVVALVMWAAPLIRTADRGAGTSWRKGMVGLVLIALMAAAAIPVLLGSFAQQRLAQVEADFATRLAHWKDALGMRDDNWLTMVLGVGLGRYPATHYWRSAETIKAASYGLARDKSVDYLRLGTGSPVYVEQVVDISAGQRYRWSLNVRSTAPAALGIALCEKWMLTSASCQIERINANAVPGQWQKVGATLSTETWTPRSWPRNRIVKFSLFSSAGPGVIEVTDVQLETEDSTPLLHNGNFSQGLDRWFFSADVDPPWHIHSLPVTVLFEQGWLGLLALAAVWATAASLAFIRTMRADPIAPALLAALLAFTLLGMFNSLVDAPRILLLILFLAWLCAHSRRLPVHGESPAKPVST